MRHQVADAARAALDLTAQLLPLLLAVHLLGALSAEICVMTVCRDAQAAGKALRATRPAGQARLLGVNETVYRVGGQEVLVGVVTAGQDGTTLAVEVLGASGSATSRHRTCDSHSARAHLTGSLCALD